MFHTCRLVRLHISEFCPTLGPLPTKCPVFQMSSLSLRKFQTKSRGTFLIGSGNVGWVATSPPLSSSSGWITSGTFIDQPTIYTGSGYAGLSYAWAVAGGIVTSPGVFATTPVSPMTSQQLQAVSVQMRCVGCGLRVRYTGTELNKGGRLILYRSRSNASVAQGSNGTTLLTDPSAYQDQVSRQWQGVTYVPDSTDMLSYLPVNSYVPSVGGDESFARRSLIAYVEGAVPGSSFDFEITSYYEVIGQRQEATPSHADPVGYGAILSALPERVTSLGQQTFQSMQRSALRALETTTSGLFQIGAAAAATSISALMASRQQYYLQGAGPTITEL